MFAPNIIEIPFELFDVPTLIRMLKKHNVGSRPAFIDLVDKDLDEQRTFLHALVEGLKHMRLNPRFPYPIYIISTKITHYGDLPILESKRELPRYYVVDKTRPTNKDQPLLKRANINLQSVLNVDLEKKFDYIRNTSFERKYLANLCRQTDFYEEILQRLGSFDDE